MNALVTDVATSLKFVRIAFLAHPAAQEAIFLRGLDDGAQDPRAESPPIECCRPLLLGCALRALDREDDHPNP
jgi:hypothetical protein